MILLKEVRNISTDRDIYAWFMLKYKNANGKFTFETYSILHMPFNARRYI